MRKTQLTIAFAFSALALSATITPASARCSPGEIANFLCNAGVINRPTANIADAAHAATGRPLDRIANQAARAMYFVPGANEYMTRSR